MRLPWRKYRSMRFGKDASGSGESVTAEQRRINHILEILPAYLVLLTPDYYVPFANRFFRERFGKSHGRRCFEYLFARSEPCQNCETYRVLKTMQPHEWEWTGPDGRYYYIYDYPFTDTEGSTLILEMGIDITAQKRAEEEIQLLNRELEQRVIKRTAELAAANKELLAGEARLKKALQEKDTLFKEVHHRVKNNLQIVQSMLDLQLPYIKDGQAAGLFKESRDRIYTMALIHEKLYKSETLLKIDLSEYIHSLVANLFSSYGVSGRSIVMDIFVADITLPASKIIPCALIINELVSNSLKHAFPRAARLAEGAGRISVHLRRDGNGGYILTVGDNGAGVPQNFSLDNCASLGLKLVKVLVKQLQGTMRLRTEGGTEFVVAFPG